MVDGVALGQVFSEWLDFPLKCDNYQRSTPIFIYMLILQEGDTGEAWEPCKKRLSFRHRGAFGGIILDTLHFVHCPAVSEVYQPRHTAAVQSTG
jgi:hypothetical protein